MKRKEAYNVLGVGENSDEKELKKAYKKLVAEKHPDKHNNSPEAEKEFKLINEAYEIATNKIPAEDDRPQNPFAGGPFRADPFGGDPFGVNSPFDWSSFGDTFNASFFKQNPFQQKKLEDLQVDITIDIKTAALGGTKEVSYIYSDLCSKCSATGFVKTDKTCVRCHGAGYIESKHFLNGFIQVVRQPCTGCNGAGGRVRCEACNGKGVSQKTNTVKVKIPPIYNPSLLRVSGKGNVNGDKHSDLYIRISIDPIGKNEYQGYVLEHNNIKTVEKLKISDILAGTELQVKHIDGTTSTVTVPPNSKIGDSLYVNNKGVVNSNGSHKIVLDILYPTKNITQQIKELIDSLYG